MTRAHRRGAAAISGRGRGLVIAAVATVGFGIACSASGSASGATCAEFNALNVDAQTARFSAVASNVTGRNPSPEELTTAYLNAVAICRAQPTTPLDDAVRATFTDTAKKSGQAAGPSTTTTTSPATKGTLVNGSVAVTGDPLPPIPDSGTDPAVGRSAPTVNGRNFDGSQVSIGGSKPKIVIVGTHWSPHSLRTFAEVQKLLDGNATDDVQIYAIATATDPQRPRFPPAEAFDTTGWKSPIVVDDAEGSAGHAFGATTFPTAVAIDSSGTVTKRVAGGSITEDWLALRNAASSGNE